MEIRMNNSVHDIKIETDQTVFSLSQWISKSCAILFSQVEISSLSCATEFSVLARPREQRKKDKQKVICISVDKVAVYQKRNCRKYIQ